MDIMRYLWDECIFLKVELIQPITLLKYGFSNHDPVNKCDPSGRETLYSLGQNINIGNMLQIPTTRTLLTIYKLGISISIAWRVYSISHQLIQLWSLGNDSVNATTILLPLSFSAYKKFLNDHTRSFQNPNKRHVVTIWGPSRPYPEKNEV